MHAGQHVPVRLLLTAVALGAAPRAQEEPEVQARIELMAELRKLDLTTEAGCKAAIVRIDDPASREIWLGSGLAPHIQDMLSRARGNLELLGTKAGTLKVHEEARSFAATHRDQPREALARYARAEEEVLARLESANRESGELASRSRADPGVVPAATRSSLLRDRLQQRYREILAESDALCAVAFPPAEIEKTPWMDLLTRDAKWSASLLQGFEHRIGNGAMVIQGPVPDGEARKEGVLSIGEGWRDFVLDFEFTFTSGAMTMHFRVGRTLVNTECMTMVSQAEGSVPPLHGRSYQGEAWMIGSRFHFHLKLDGTNPNEVDTRWVTSRKGALALVIPDGTQVKFTRLRVRVLR